MSEVTDDSTVKMVFTDVYDRDTDRGVDEIVYDRDTDSGMDAFEDFLQDERGNYYKIDSTGNLTFKDDKGVDFTYSTEKGGFTDKDGNFAGGNFAISDYIKKYGNKALDLLKTNGKYDPAKLATLGLGAYALMNKDKQGGYSRPVPKLDMVREQVQYNDPNRRPGEGGRQYFTDPRFVAEGKPEDLAAGQAASAAQASGIQAAYKASAAQVNPYAGKIPTAFNPKTEVTNTKVGLPAIPTADTATGGLGFPVKTDSTPLAEGGLADAGRYLRGETDGMADKIPSNIDGEQPAALSHGEFVIPADVVSHLGNGNSDAGAKKLYEMMDRIRVMRTGKKEQGKEINADKVISNATGGLAYFRGGVAGFNVGGAAGLDTPNPVVAGAGGVANDVSRTSTLSPYVGEYVTDALAQGRALAKAPMEVYKGPLTAGESNLQQQAFAGASDLASAGFTPGQFNFGAEQASQYMNPYLQASLDPQLKELKRQSDIARLDDAGRLTRAGAFGGSRQAVMESEGRRNLLDKQASLIGSGYKSAFDTGMGQFNRERDAEEKSRETSADFGLKTVAQLADLGATQRGITSEGLKADKEQFEEQRDYAYAMPKYQLGLLSGLPIAANTTSVDQDALSKMQSTVSGLGATYKKLDEALAKLIPK